MTVDATKPVKGAGTQFFMAAEAGTAKPNLATEGKVIRLADVKELGAPEMSAEETEDSYLDSPDPEWKEKTPGQIDPGQLTVTLAWKPADATQKQLTNLLGKEKRWFFIKYPNGAWDGFYGFVSSVGKAIQAKETITRSVKISLSGRQSPAESDWNPAA